MSRSPKSPFHRRASRRFVGVIAGLAVAVLSSAPATALPEAQTVPLHNDQAQTSTDCPNTVGSYWHFVISPNDNGYAFVSMSLALNGVVWSFSGSEIIPNAGQLDNVYVEVPEGFTVASLGAAGSSARITPATGSPKFVLSHVCTGTGTTTTTSTTPRTTTTTTQPAATTTTTTIAPTTSTTTQPAQPTSTTTTSVAPEGGTTTTTQASGGPTTSSTTVSPAAATTTTQVASEGPTTTAGGGALPRTGAGNARTTAVAIGTLALGLGLVAITRRRLTA